MPARWWLLLLWLAGATAGAHTTPGSALRFDLQAHRVDATLTLPLVELELAFGQPLSAAPEAALARHREALEAYVLGHIALLAPDGREWSKQVTAQRIDATGTPVDLVVQLRLVPPAGAPERRFQLRSDVIAHEVNNHTTLILLGSDWQQGRLHQDAEPTLLGALGFMRHQLDVQVDVGSHWNGFGGALRLGMRHIAEGVDHLLFLLVLLLPTPLIVIAGRWQGHAGVRRSVRQQVWIVSAFTLGHSITLAAGTLHWLNLPSTAVEIAIAASILVSAVHAFRPLFPGRETWVAGGFGLIHGLAFSGVLAELGLAGMERLLALLGFNLGIELVQLLVVAITVPWLVLLARTPAYGALRIGGALIATLAACVWLLDRAFGWLSTAATWMEATAPHAIWLPVALAAWALATRSWRAPGASTG